MTGLELVSIVDWSPGDAVVVPTAIGTPIELDGYKGYQPQGTARQ